MIPEPVPKSKMNSPKSQMDILEFVNQEFYHRYSDSCDEDPMDIATTPSDVSFFLRARGLPFTYLNAGTDFQIAGYLMR